MIPGARGFATRLLAAALLLVSAAAGVQSWRLARAERAHRATAMRADSLEAANDTTRAVGGRAARAIAQLYGAQMAGVERRAVQVAQRGDALDRTLGRARVALVEARAVIDSLEASAQVPVVADVGDSVRIARAQLRRAPYSVSLFAALPRPPDSARFGVAVALDTARLALRLQCGAPKDGIRPATALVVTPRWLRVSLDSVTQAPEVCQDRPRPGWFRRAWEKIDGPVWGLLGLWGGMKLEEKRQQ